MKAYYFGMRVLKSYKELGIDALTKGKILKIAGRTKFIKPLSHRVADKLQYEFKDDCVDTRKQVYEFYKYTFFYLLFKTCKDSAGDIDLLIKWIEEVKLLPLVQDLITKCAAFINNPEYIAYDPATQMKKCLVEVFQETH